MKKLLSFVGLLGVLLAPQKATAWISFLNGGSLPQNNGWLLDGSDSGTIVALGGGNQGIQQTDDTAGAYVEWYVVDTNKASTLAARFRVDSYGGGPVNILQLTPANSGANPSPALAVAIRDNRLFLIRFLADSAGAPVEDARLADLGPLELGVFYEAYLYIDNATDRVRLFWNGGLRYSAVDANAAYHFSGGGFAEFGASNYWPDNDRSGISTVTFDWVALGDASDLPLNLPFIPWTAYLDGSTLPLPGVPWLFYQEGGNEGGTVVVDFLDPDLSTMNQALRINSGANSTEWYVGALFQDEVFGGARFKTVAFSGTDSENLLCVQVGGPNDHSAAPAITIVTNRYKLWSYTEGMFGSGVGGSEIMDLGPVVVDQFHTAYVYAHRSGVTRVWWDGNLIFNGIAPQVPGYDGYMEWGSGSWQFRAATTVDFDWVAYGAQNISSALLITFPTNGAVFQDPSAGFSFTNVSVDGVAGNGVVFSVNGTDRTSELVIAGDDNNRQGFWGGLVSNQLYGIVLILTELDGDRSTNIIIFDTFSQNNLVFEAEDWNIDTGQFIDNPVLTSDPFEPNSYFGKSAFDEIDHHELNTLPGAAHDYRATVLVGTEVSGDVLRQNYIDAQVMDPAVRDYNVGWVEVGEWLNYTRTFPPGVYYIYGRFANGNIGACFVASMGKVANATVGNQVVTPLGVFSRTGPGRGWQSYDYVPLTDANGNLVGVSLNGVETLRVTLTQGGFNANFYVLVAAPRLQISRSNGNVVVSWTGAGFTLQSASSINGPWNPVLNQSNPYIVSAVEPARFYRLFLLGRPLPPPCPPPPTPPAADVTFNDRGDGALDGSYAGLDWGSGVWAVGGPWAGINSQNAYQGASGDPATGRISSGAGGAFLLESLVATADRAWTISLIDNNGQMFTQDLAANTPATLTTGWTMPSEWVDVTSSVGYFAVIDDLNYSR